MKKETKHKGLLPPGFRLTYELMGYGLVLLLLILLSSQFLWSFREAYGSMYYYGPAGKRILFEDALMSPLPDLLTHSFSGIWILLLYNVFMVIFHYRSFYGESKSIYLMKRIEDSTELHRRCLTMPLLSMLAGILLSIMLFYFYRYLYYHITPAQCLPEYSPLNIWRILL